MRVTQLETIVIDNVEPYWGGKQWLFIKLHTDEGIVGLGERPTAGLKHLGAQVALLEELAEEFVIGQSPFDIELMWNRMYSVGHDYRHPDMTRTPAISAIEIALWDIIGKAAGQPIYNLLGGRAHEKLRAYSYMPTMANIIQEPEAAADGARQLVETGWTATKIDPFAGGPFLPRDFSLSEIKRAARVFEIIRDEVGDALEVGIGTHGQFSTAGAIRVARIFEQYEPMWFEEPVPPEQPREMARVAAQTSVPIASGERLATKYEFATALEEKAMGIVQLDVAQCGGILESKKIAGIAEAHYALTAPHMYVGPIAAAAAVQLDTCSPNFMIQEFNTGSLHRDIIEQPILVEDGWITPPTGPGLGIALDDAVVERYRAR